MRLALLFNGQGQQSFNHMTWLKKNTSHTNVQKLKALIPSIFEEDDAIDLYHNDIAQPLIFTIQMTAWAYLQEKIPKPICVAGYSLGEMAATSCAGVFSFDTGIELCRLRAHLMSHCVSSEYGLLSVIGLNEQAVRKMADSLTVEIAIRNGPSHFIVGGPSKTLANLADIATQMGAKRVTTLAVNIPSHTHFLHTAGEKFTDRLRTESLSPPMFPVISGLNGSPSFDTPSVIRSLGQSIYTTLDWYACLQSVKEMQPNVVLEVGAGNALSKMWLEIDSSIPIRSTDEFHSFAGVLSWLNRFSSNIR